jgi:hypothetical protein
VRARRWLIIAGLASGLVAFGIGEAIYGLIRAKEAPVDTMGHILMVPTMETSNIANTQNGALTFGVLGLCLGGFLGMAGGLARRSTSAMVTAGLIGSVLGMALTAGASFALLPYFLKTLPDHADYDLILSMIMHGSIWGLAGASGGLAFAIGLGQPRLLWRSLAAGFVGAAIGAIAFDVIGGGLFPLANTVQPISTSWPTRLMARLIVTVTTTGVIMLLLPGVRAKRSAVIRDDMRATSVGAVKSIVTAATEDSPS